jgi:hypothetical protein
MVVQRDTSGLQAALGRWRARGTRIALVHGRSAEWPVLPDHGGAGSGGPGGCVDVERIVVERAKRAMQSLCDTAIRLPASPKRNLGSARMPVSSLSEW